MKTIRVFEAFAGYGSQLMALERLQKMFGGLNIQPIGYSEIDPIPIKAYELVHGTDIKNYGDISKIDWNSVPDFDLFTYSFCCVCKEALILTKEGYKQMADIKVGDIVLTRTGEYHPVVKKFDNGIQPTCYLQGLGFENLHVTYTHKFLTRNMYRAWDNKTRSYNRCFSNPKYKQVKDLTKNDYFGIPCPQEGELPKWNGTIDNRWGHEKPVNTLSAKFENPSFWYLMGRYVGDGWRRASKSGNGIIICCGGRNEDKLEENIKSCGFHYTLSKTRTTNEYIISIKELYEFVVRYGLGAQNKRIDGETMRLPLDLLKAFIDGCIDSDGCYTQDRYKITTISRELAYGLSYCINRVYKRHCCIGKYERSKNCVIEGRVCNQHDTYQITFTKEIRKQDKAFYEDGYIWFPFKGVIPAKMENVYNIEVDTEHSYIMQGCISKNCQDISNAGRQAGFEKGSGTRSSLLWECEKAIKIKRPKYLLLENVRALVSKKFLPHFKEWCALLDGYGYKSFYQILNACDYGVPQNRERVFMVSILRTEDDPDPKYYFPKPFELDRCLKDVLEEDVDEKYYLKQSQVDLFLANSVDGKYER